MWERVKSAYSVLKLDKLFPTYIQMHLEHTNRTTLSTKEADALQLHNRGGDFVNTEEEILFDDYLNRRAVSFDINLLTIILCLVNDKIIYGILTVSYIQMLSDASAAVDI